jgi:hypothetical protein
MSMTRMSGQGALAHEWWHGLDHLAGDHGVSIDDQSHALGAVYASGGDYRQDTVARRLSRLSPAEAEAWAAFMGAIYSQSGQRTDFVRHAYRLAEERGNYWNRPVELAARAAEASIFCLLTRRGARSDYLVSDDVDRETRDRLKRPIREYPAGAEREAVTDLVLSLVRSMARRLAG